MKEEIASSWGVNQNTSNRDLLLCDKIGKYPFPAPDIDELIVLSLAHNNDIPTPVDLWPSSNTLVQR